MYWIIGGIVLLIILYKKLVSFTIAKNVTSRYYALKDIFANDDEIGTERFLEMAGVFSQIVDVKNKNVLIEDINDIAKKAVKYSKNITEVEMLTEFCFELTRLVYMGSGLSIPIALDRAKKEIESIEKDVNFIKNKGFSNVIYRSTMKNIEKNPGCLSGNYKL